MKVELISYVIKGHVRDEFLREDRLDSVANIINSSEADLIVFSGWTLDVLAHIPILLKLLTNKKVSVCFEVFDESIDTVKANKGYVLIDGKIVNLEMSQQFSTSGEVNKSDEVIEGLLDKIEADRKINIGGKNCLWLSCGELNILKNLQSEGNKVVFRSDDNVRVPKNWSV